MTLCGDFVGKPRCRSHPQVQVHSYTQNIHRTCAGKGLTVRRGVDLILGHFFGRERHARARTDQTACKPGSVPPSMRTTRRSFLWTVRCRTVLATYPDILTGDGPAGLAADAISLFGLAPGGACRAVPVTRSAVGSYPTLSPLPPWPKPKGGLLSVALSLGSPPAGVTRRLVTVEPGLSSPLPLRGEGRPPGRLIRTNRDGGRGERQVARVRP